MAGPDRRTALVAPQARILPEKVLDSEGYGTLYGAAQAILDATAAHAKVINVSFGTEAQPPSYVLQQAIQQARRGRGRGRGRRKRGE